MVVPVGGALARDRHAPAGLVSRGVQFQERPAYRLPLDESRVEPERVCHVVHAIVDDVAHRLHRCEL